MSSISSIIDLVHPAVSGTSVIISDQIWILFDRELDETTVAGGNFFVSGPDYDTWSGPDLQIYQDSEQTGDELEILQSPGYHGLLDGEITFQRIDNNSLATVSGTDTAGSGFLYRSKLIFTPTNRLQTDTEYEVHLTGDEDETDTLKTGISARTVFDPVTSGLNVGTGSVEFTGGYIGNATEDTYRIIITPSGEVGTSKFTFVRDTDPLSVYGPFKTRRSGVLLSDGVTATFDEGIYVPGDQWSSVVKERTVFTGNALWPFKTGSGSIVEIPTTTSTSVIGDPVSTSTTSTSSSTFTVESTDPADHESHITIIPGEFNITVEFDSDINPLTVVSGIDLSVYSESVTGDTDVDAVGTLIAEPSISGPTLTIIVASGQLYQNNLVTVTLDKTISNTSGISLGSDYSFEFTTQYSPMYCTLRRIRLLIGAYVGDVSDDTINLAIHIASLEADLLTWNKSYDDDEYYKFARSQWTCCRAAQIILVNTVGNSNSLKAKQLGDLRVEYNTSSDVSKPLANAEECLMRWEGALQAGGRQVQSAKMTVKGDYDPDRIDPARMWINTDLMPASNSRISFSTSRRTRRYYAKGWWSKS